MICGVWNVFFSYFFNERNKQIINNKFVVGKNVERGSRKNQRDVKTAQKITN